MRVGSLVVGSSEFAVGLSWLDLAFQSHNLLEGALTAKGVLVGIVAVVGFLFLHDSLHRIPRAIRLPASRYLDDYFVAVEGD